MIKGFLTSLQFLTRIGLVPNLSLDERDFARSLGWYPIVGLIVGISLGVAYEYILRMVWPDLVARALVIVILVWLKDGFHLEGLSDLADGLYGARERHAVINIMKDSSIGAMGAITVISVFFLQTAVVFALPSETVFPALMLGVLLSTSAGALLLTWEFDPLTPDGLAAVFLRHSSRWTALLIEGISLILAVAIGGLGGLVLFAGGFGATLLFAYWARSRLGGINGDCCGAWIILLQTGLLLCFLGLVHNVSNWSVMGIIQW